MDVNCENDICYTQPTTLAERVAIARDFAARFDYPLPLAVDDMDNAAEEAFAAWPERLYIVGGDGRIAYKGGLGPFDYEPGEVRAWLETEFPSPDSAARSRRAAVR